MYSDSPSLSCGLTLACRSILCPCRFHLASPRLRLCDLLPAAFWVLTMPRSRQVDGLYKMYTGTGKGDL